MPRFTYDKRKVISMYQSGESIRMIANHFQADYRAIWQLVMRQDKLKRRGNRRLELKWKRFGKLFVLRLFKAKPKTTWVVQCDCGTRKVVLGSSLTGERGSKSCGCEVGMKKGSLHKLWCGHGEMSGSFWCKLKETAEKRGHEVKITPKEAWELFTNQGGKCALSGLPIKFAVDAFSHSHGATSASLDRINSKKGYVSGNVQWVHKMINRMKWGLVQDAFIGLCRKVSEYAEMNQIQSTKPDGVDFTFRGKIATLIK